MDELRGHLRIGELSRRVGVSRELLRAWERRYGLVQPIRSPGDFRLYSLSDEERVRAMLRYLQDGLSAAQAAQAAGTFGDAAERSSSDILTRRAEIRAALENFDEARVHALLDGLFATFGIVTVLRAVILPLLRSLGDDWSAGEITVAQEHFASNVLRGRLLGLARARGNGNSPLAVLACPPGEQHDIGLLIFGIAMRQAGWRITFLGANTPIATIEDAAESLNARVIVLSTVARRRLRASEQEIASLTERRTVAIGGAGAGIALAESIGAVLLQSDPIAAANGLLQALDRHLRPTGGPGPSPATLRTSTSGEPTAKDV
jgi:DNA-binding transcriptional MerR regulator/methylmalonyl-CoA mutase cobalamin-binding subunit